MCPRTITTFALEKKNKRFISGITYKGSKTMIILNYVVISLAAKAMSLMKK